MTAEFLVNLTAYTFGTGVNEARPGEARRRGPREYTSSLDAQLARLLLTRRYSI